METKKTHIIYENSIRYLQNNLSQEEESLFLNSLEKDYESKTIFYRVKDIWEYQKLKDKADNLDLDSIWFQFNKELKKEKIINKFFIKYSKWIAAASVIIIVSLSFFIGFNKYNKTTLTHSFQCAKGDMVQSKLSDGTRIWLNSESELIIPSDFSSTNRKLTLSGEAFFDVTSDKAHPFEIKIAEQKVIVKGTKFNVKYYPGDVIFETTLEEGVVYIKNKNDKEIKLTPGFQLLFNTKNNKYNIVKTNVKQHSSWRQGRYVFEDMQLNDVIKSVERWYECKVIFIDKDLKTMKISGVLKRNKTLEHFLKVLNTANPISFKIENDTIYIKRKINLK